MTGSQRPPASRVVAATAGPVRAGRPPIRAVAGHLDALITRERVRNYSWIFVVLGVLAHLLNGALGAFPVTASGEVLLPDYLAHWTGARLVLQGQAAVLYDPAVQAQLQHEQVPGSPGLSWFVSPPFTVLLYLPLALLPYEVSALVWCALTVGLLVMSLLLLRPLVPASVQIDYRLLALVFAASPALLALVAAGQDTAVVLVLFVVGLRCLAAGRDVTAGCLLALTAFKPQLLVFVPLVLLLPVMTFVHARMNHRCVRLLGAGAAVLLATIALRHLAAGQLGWPQQLVEAPWSAVPLLVLWVMMLRLPVDLSAGAGRQPSRRRSSWKTAGSVVLHPRSWSVLPVP